MARGSDSAKVYISSTFSDLVAHRSQVATVLQRMHLTPVFMENYTAYRTRPVDRCLADVDGCSIFIGILGSRYGCLLKGAGELALPPGAKVGVTSITEMEYLQAVDRGKAVLMFLSKEWDESACATSESPAAAASLARFRNLVAAEHLREFFESPEDLALKVSVALYNAMLTGEPSRSARADYCERVRESVSLNELPYRSIIGDSGNSGREVPLSKIYIRHPFRAARGAQSQEQTSSTTLDQVLCGSRNIFIQGEPGSGKSSMCRHLAVQLATCFLSGDSPKFIPVYLPARPLAAIAQTHGGSLLDRAVHIVRAQLRHSLDEAFFKTPLRADWKWLIIVDGIDEIPSDDERKRLLGEIAVESDRLRAVAKFIVASRPFGYSVESLSPDRYDRYIIEPFTQAQARELAARWFEYLGCGSRIAEAFFAQIEGRNASFVLQTPVLLTLATLLFANNPEAGLPPQRVELYRRFVRLMIRQSNRGERRNTVADEWERELPGFGGRVANKLLSVEEILLAQLALVSQQVTDLHIVSAAFEIARTLVPELGERTAEDEVQWLKEKGMARLLLQSGLMQEVADLTFSHNTVREFLAALALHQMTAASPSQTEKLLDRWTNSRWREIVLMYLAMMCERGAQKRLIATHFQALMRCSLEGAIFVAQAVGEGVQLEPEDLLALLEELVEHLGQWNLCAELFSEFRTPDPIPSLRLLMKFDTCRNALWQVLINKQHCGKSLTRLLQFGSEFFSTGQLREIAANAALVSVRLEAAKCLAETGDIDELRRLADALESDEKLTLCLEIAHALATYGMDWQPTSGKEDRSAMFAFVRCMGRSVISPGGANIDECLRLDGDNRETADWRFELSCWRKMLADQVELDQARKLLASISCADDMFEPLCRRLAAHGTHDSEQVVQLLVDLASDTKQPAMIRVSFVRCLRDLGRGAEVRNVGLALLPRLDDSQRADVCKYVMDAGDPNPALAFIRDEAADSWYRGSLAIDLGKAGYSEQVVPLLRDLMNSAAVPDVQRLEFAYALAMLREDSAIDGILTIGTREGLVKRACRMLFYLEQWEHMKAIIVNNASDVEGCEFCMRALARLGAVRTLQQLADDPSLPTGIRDYALQQMRAQ